MFIAIKKNRAAKQRLIQQISGEFGVPCSTKYSGLAAKYGSEPSPKVLRLMFNAVYPRT